VFLPVLKGVLARGRLHLGRPVLSYPWSDAWRLFLGDWSRAISQEYRPLWAISFMVDLGISGLRPVALHVTNVALHLVACWLVWKLADEARGRPA
jgi:hypothetical protein